MAKRYPFTAWAKRENRYIEYGQWRLYLEKK
jgi:hypothetical protein